MSVIQDSIRKTILGRIPLVYLESSEERRTIKLLEAVRVEVAPDSVLREWSCVSGLDGMGEDSRDPVVAICAVLKERRPGFYVFKDLDAFMKLPMVVRVLRDIYSSGVSEAGVFFFILSPRVDIPESIKKEVHLLTVPMPDGAELLEAVKRFQGMHAEATFPADHLQEIALALKGMTLGESEHLMYRLFQEKRSDRKQIMDEIFAEKQMIVKKTGYLEFYPPRWDIGQIGGMGAMKEWLTTRKHMFSQEALDAGIPIPKGLLMMGVSGCGKSLAVKVISSLWNIPLFRLDMSLVFSGLYGTPEAAFHNALGTIEAVSPALLWIDEIENALGMDESGNSISSQIFSSFLTWMQEKPPLVFIAATANKINALPAEVLRKGRFDEVFFIDLPNDIERQEIIEIHLRNQGADPAQFDMKTLVAMTKDWNGAEVEQAVIGARVNAYSEQRTMTMRDVSFGMTKIVPLSTTMEQQIKFIRSWAFSRATPASKSARIGRR